MRYDPLGRRLFLTGLGGAAVAIPFLPSLLPRELQAKAEAQGATAPRRFLAIKTYNGAPILHWMPSRAPTGYGTHDVDGSVRLNTQLSVATGRHANGEAYFGHEAPLSDFAATGVSNVFGDEFTPFLDRMTLFRGLDFMPNLNHNHGGFLGNLGFRTFGVGGPLPGAQINVTIDQVMARSAAVYPTAPLGPRVLHVGSRTDTCSFEPRDPSNLLATGEGAVQRATAFTNPRTAFDAVFRAFVPDDDPGGPEVPLSARLMDRVLDDYRRAQRNPRLSRDDRQTLEPHVGYLADLARRLGGSDAPAPSSCDVSSPPASTDSGGEFDVGVSTIETFMRDMVDVLVLAFACDATRVATFDVQKMIARDAGDIFGIGDSENPFSAGRSNWHLQAHNWDANAIRWLSLGYEWIAEVVVARLLRRMDEVMEGSGRTLLDNSLVLWGNELSFNHLNYNMPTVLFGTGGGVVRAGRYLDYVDHDRPIRFRQHDGNVVEGVQYNRLLVSLLQAMGLRADEYETSPGAGFGEARAVDKGDGFARDYDASNVDQALPDLLV